MYPGIADRMQKEITALAPSTIKIKVFFGYKYPSCASWHDLATVDLAKHLLTSDQLFPCVMAVPPLPGTKAHPVSTICGSHCGQKITHCFSPLPLRPHSMWVHPSSELHCFTHAKRVKAFVGSVLR